MNIEFTQLHVCMSACLLHDNLHCKYRHLTTVLPPDNSLIRWWWRQLRHQQQQQQQHFSYGHCCRCRCRSSGAHSPPGPRRCYPEDESRGAPVPELRVRPDPQGWQLRQHCHAPQSDSTGLCWQGSGHDRQQLPAGRCAWLSVSGLLLTVADLKTLPPPSPSYIKYIPYIDM